MTQKWLKSADKQKAIWSGTFLLLPQLGSISWYPYTTCTRLEFKPLAKPKTHLISFVDTTNPEKQSAQIDILDKSLKLSLKL